jgi:hypothetical protein
MTLMPLSSAVFTSGTRARQLASVTTRWVVEEVSLRSKEPPLASVHFWRLAIEASKVPEKQMVAFLSLGAIVAIGEIDGQERWDGDDC